MAAVLLISPAAYSFASGSCQECHQEMASFSPFHEPKALGCGICHRGDSEKADKDLAHLGIIPSPGTFKNIRQTCGQAECHETLGKRLPHSIMNSLAGIIQKTRELFNEDPTIHKKGLHEELSTKGADSYLRKLCVSCHLGNVRDKSVDESSRRGGGCLACHLRTGEPSEDQKMPHPTLSLQVDDSTCFGCHSRSGRISLNYVGLAEVEKIDEKRANDFAHLEDGRLVEYLPADLHAVAGLGCVDCHTSRGVMGNHAIPKQGGEQLDISCKDCHGKTLRQKAVSKLSEGEMKLLMLATKRYSLQKRSMIPVTKKGSPLPLISEKQGTRQLRIKNHDKTLSVPVMQDGTHHQLLGHERLSCQACHSTWAPNCYGCHVEYEPTGKQYDHLERKITPGRWKETRWWIENREPALGVTKNNRIMPFIPGMNITIEQPDKPTITRQRFAPISPHTTQKSSRTCRSCHASPVNLGIPTKAKKMPGRPDITTKNGWISPLKTEGERGFNGKERTRILKVGKCLLCHSHGNSIYQDFPRSLQRNSSKPCGDEIVLN